MSEGALPKMPSPTASLCGLVLRRLQDLSVADDPEKDDTAVTVADLSKIFGEALKQFS
jgi:hypothetical protein